MQIFKNLKNKFNNKTALIGIVGLGYVGLPLLLRYVEAGYRVLGLDIDPEKPKKLHADQTYIKHIPAEVIAASRHGFEATTDFSRAKEADALILCVPTPLNAHREFEFDFVAYLGGGLEAIAVNSATAGLHLGLEAMGVGPGDQVITTTHTFTATAEIIRYLGADPVFVDVDAATLCINVDAVAHAITPRTKAIVPVHFAGRSADMARLLALAKQYGLKVMEDAAHALPTTCDGRLIGTLESDITVFSFYANKTITTGEGGMLVTRDPDLAKRARVMRLHGINRDAFDRFTSKAPSWYYEIVAPGFKYNMTDIAASMGIHQLKKAN